MWPLYIFLNKSVKTKENAHGSDGNHSNFVESSSFELPLSNGKCHEADMPHSHFVEVPHISQQCTWDCGLACILMVLETVGINGCNIQALGELCCTTSIWTVDLAYLLHNFSVNFSYFTVTFGANPNFSVETFYKEQLPNDLVRVNMLFQKAFEAGIHIQDAKTTGFYHYLLHLVEEIKLSFSVPFRCATSGKKCRSISGEEISLYILSGKYIAVALVDQYKLSRSWSEDVCISDFYDGKSGYTGHYVIICGYDANTDEFEIRDPASSRKHERIPLNCLEEARKSFGTDEDLLLISIEKTEHIQSPSFQLSSRVNSDS